MKIETIHPEGWARASGYSNGILVSGAGRQLFLAGQVAWDAQQKIVGEGDFARQFEQILRNILAILEAAGGAPEQLVRLTIFVLDKQQYLDALQEVGRIYREQMGRHYPAMSLVQVAALLEEGALLEIEATAVLP